MKFISLFAGIGGLDLGLERAGFECVAQVEINEFCQQVLQKHWSSVPKFKDVRDVGKHNLPTADLICGGFPCQDVSLAGERAGLEGKRSTLWSEFYRIVCEIRPRWIVIENVPGLLSSDNGEFFTKILRELSQSGYDVEWQVIPAAFFGAPHIRERVFIVGYPSGGEWQVPNIPQVFRVENFGKRNKTKRGEGGNMPSMGWENNSGLEREWNDWSNQPAIKRVVDGLPFGMDRLGALGNAVVPQAAEFVGLCIRKAETRLTQRPPDVGYAPRPQALSTTEADSLAQVKASPAHKRVTQSVRRLIRKGVKMFGKWVTVNLGEGIKCEVFVLCVPSTPDDVLQERAVAQLSSRLTKRAADERNAPEGVDVSVAFGG